MMVSLDGAGNASPANYQWFIYQMSRGNLF